MSRSSCDKDRTRVDKKTHTDKQLFPKYNNRSIFIVRGDNNQSAFCYFRIYGTIVTHVETIITNRKCVFYCQKLRNTHSFCQTTHTHKPKEGNKLINNSERSMRSTHHNLQLMFLVY